MSAGHGGETSFLCGGKARPVSLGPLLGTGWAGKRAGPLLLPSLPGLPLGGLFKLQPQLGFSVVAPLPFSSLMELIPHKVQIFRICWLS